MNFRANTDTVLADVWTYHQATKHDTNAYAPGPGFLDWDSQPDPFRRFDGAPLVPLPLVEGTGLCTYDALFQTTPAVRRMPTPAQLSLFLELALGLSAWKVMGADRWALHNNPSSGNLHPTEGYLLLWGTDFPDLEPGLYHYRPDLHALERRAVLSEAIATVLAKAAPGAWGALGLSSAIWREEWKYGSRAFRYCQLDVGHAIAAARIAARVVGWSLRVDLSPSDATVAACLGINRTDDFACAESEHPDLLALLGAPDSETSMTWTELAAALSGWCGMPSRLSEEPVRWPEIARVLPAVVKDEIAPAKPAQSVQEGIATPSDSPDAAALIRRRRSAQRMDGKTGIGHATFECMLRRTLPEAGQLPFDALTASPAINLLLFVHSVEGLKPGLYLLLRTSERFEALRGACGEPALEWIPLPGDLPLYSLATGSDMRKVASQLSCYQGIAGRGAFSVAMLADMERVLATEGAWAYRRLFWECGMIGQLLYLEAEAAGLSGTGIGCFFDDGVHRLLGLGTGPGAGWQDLYHFTVGQALVDERLTTEAPYGHLSQRERIFASES